MSNTAKPKIGVLLSGCGVYDGAEIHESVLTLLAIDTHGAEAVCLAPDKPQHHVVNHLTGAEMPEQRNALVEAARIARGNIKNLADVTANDINALVIPGGFGAAKNLTQWAFHGPEGTIDAEVKRLITEMVAVNKPIAGLCMGPTVIAKALEGSGVNATLTVGTDQEPSPYEIAAISAGMEKVGAKAEMRSLREISVDAQHRIVTAPCYMMEGGIGAINSNIQMAIEALIKLL